MASAKQVNYVINLLAGAGYSTRYMNAEFKSLGATMRERSGSVEAWVAGKTNPEISKLINELKPMQCGRSDRAITAKNDSEIVWG